MHVLHVLYYWPPFPGGIVAHLVELGAAFRSRGDRISFAFPEDQAWLSVLKPFGDVLVLPEIRRPFRKGLRASLDRVCRERGVDLVHLHFAYCLPLALALSPRPWRVPVVYHWHNPPRVLLPRRLQRRKPLLPIRRAVARVAAGLGDRRVITRHLVISSEIESLLLQHRWTRPGKIYKLKNALIRSGEANGDAPRATPGRVIGTVANFRPQKDHRTLLRAFGLLVRSCPDSRLIFVGDGPERAQAERLAGELGVGERVEFTGFVEDPRVQYRRFDVFVLSTHYEGHPLALMEAMDHGLPLVCTDTPATREAVRPGEDGFLVPPEDPEALAGALERLITDPGLARRFGESGRERVRNEFGPEPWVRGVLALYESMLVPE